MTESFTHHVVASVKTDAGCVREANEDNGRHIQTNTPEIRERRGTMTIVADGMGGHASGEIASEMAVDLISSLYFEDHESDPQTAMHAAIVQANSQIFEHSQTSDELFGMGTTMIALVLLGDRGFSAHVGDSRLYRLRCGEMELLTMDHSQVMEMVRHGVISQKEARNHDDKNIILRAIGTQDSVEPEISEFFLLEPGDEFLLCSDGLNDMISDDEIADIWRSRRDIHTASERLIAEAKAKGGHDNITVGIVRVSNGTASNTAGNVRVTREIEAAV